MISDHTMELWNFIEHISCPQARSRDPTLIFDPVDICTEMNHRPPV